MKQVLKNNFWDNNVVGNWMIGMIVDFVIGTVIEDGFSTEEEAQNRLSDILLADLKNIKIPDVKEIEWDGKVHMDDQQWQQESPEAKKEWIDAWLREAAFCNSLY